MSFTFNIQHAEHIPLTNYVLVHGTLESGNFLINQHVFIDTPQGKLQAYIKGAPFDQKNLKSNQLALTLAFVKPKPESIELLVGLAIYA